MILYDILDSLPHSTVLIFIFSGLGAAVSEFKCNEKRRKKKTKFKVFLDFLCSWVYGFSLSCIAVEKLNIENYNLIMSNSALIGGFGYSIIYKIYEKTVKGLQS